MILENNVEENQLIGTFPVAACVTFDALFLKA